MPYGTSWIWLKNTSKRASFTSQRTHYCPYARQNAAWTLESEMWHLTAIPASHHTTPYETVLVNTHQQRLCFLFENYMFKKKKKTGGETFAKEAVRWNWHILDNCRLHRWPFRKSPSLPPRQRLKGGFLNQERESCWSPFPVNIKVSCKCNSSQRCLKEERAAWTHSLAQTQRLSQPCNVPDLLEVLSQPSISWLLLSLLCLRY